MKLYFCYESHYNEALGLLNDYEIAFKEEENLSLSFEEESFNKAKELLNNFTVPFDRYEWPSNFKKCLPILAFL